MKDIDKIIQASKMELTALKKEQEIYSLKFRGPSSKDLLIIMSIKNLNKQKECIRIIKNYK
tara:strand:- start:264 stop:446 length:183 start_codon:yes stop_codon:yes gene_type:complete